MKVNVEDLYVTNLCDDADMPTIFIQVIHMEEFAQEINIHMLMPTCQQINL